MDTSSKAWLPHQSQFGLVGQAEVCCGGPGVNLTPSESADLPSVGCTVTASSPVCPGPIQPLFSLYMFFYVTNARPRPCCQCGKKFAFFPPNTHRRLCAARLVSPFPPRLRCPFADTMELYKIASAYPGFFILFFYFSPLSPAAERHSPSEPRFVTLPEFHFDMPPGFDGTICLLLQL